MSQHYRDSAAYIVTAYKGRAETKLSNANIAEQLKISPGHFSNVLSGHSRANDDLVAKMASLFGVSIKAMSEALRVSRLMHIQ